MRYFIIGLGNPGAQYEGNRHNIGFMALDGFVQDCERGRNTSFSTKGWYPKDRGMLYELQDPGSSKIFYLCKPMGFMNLSGRCVAPLIKFYKIPEDRVLVIHDDLDLPLGSVRCKKGGGAGGHNGIKDMIQNLGSPDFWRLRLGIGRPDHKNLVSSYVLGNFTPFEIKSMEDLWVKVLQEIDSWMNLENHSLKK